MNFNDIEGGIRKIIKYISDHILLRNLVLATLILLVGVMLIMQVLKIYTRHNYNLTVPDFTGLTFEDAADLALSKDLRVEIIDSVYLDEFEKGTVVDQDPYPFFKVKKNRRIFLTMNAVNPERVAMPDLVDLTVRQARARLESSGLVIGDITYVPDIGINVVLEQKTGGRKVEPGDSIIKGSSIDLVAGKGISNETTSVPDLRGLTVDEAKIAASDQFLTIGAVVPDQSILTDEDQAKALIFRQSPQVGSNSAAALGSTIDVWLTLDSLKLYNSLPAADSLGN
jgi:eukaryotic-like serine/threonine-protein kinase